MSLSMKLVGCSYHANFASVSQLIAWSCGQSMTPVKVDSKPSEGLGKKEKGVLIFLALLYFKFPCKIFIAVTSFFPLPNAAGSAVNELL